MRSIPSFCAAICLALTASMGTASANNIPDQFEVGSTVFGDWEVRAQTSLRMDYTAPGGVRYPDGIPFYESSRCRAVSGTIAFEMNEKLEVQWVNLTLMQFRTPEGEIMPERSFDMYLDGDRYEIGYQRSQPLKLTNFDYPAVYESTPGFAGYMAFRPVAEANWLPIRRLIDRMMAAGAGHVGMLPLTQQTRADDQYDPRMNNSSMSLDISGLKRAANWCAEVMHSAAARTIPTLDDAGTAPIVKATTEDQFDDAMRARWNIEVLSGGGIPGSAGADNYIRDADSVLQNIVDRCQLGQTILVRATDGVSLLAILEKKLSPTQISCIRSFERPGLTLKDRGNDG